MSTKYDPTNLELNETFRAIAEVIIEDMAQKKYSIADANAGLEKIAIYISKSIEQKEAKEYSINKTLAEGFLHRAEGDANKAIILLNNSSGKRISDTHNENERNYFIRLKNGIMLILQTKKESIIAQENYKKIQTEKSKKYQQQRDILDMLPDKRRRFAIIPETFKIISKILLVVVLLLTVLFIMHKSNKMTNDIDIEIEVGRYAIDAIFVIISIACIVISGYIYALLEKMINKFFA